MRVSIRNMDTLKRMLESGEDIDLPPEAYHNSWVLRQILSRQAYRILPEISELADDELRRLTNSVSYIMRPDEIIAGQCIPGSIPPFKCGEGGDFSRDGIDYGSQIQLSNDPSIINPDWELRESDCKGGDWDKIRIRGSEYFRCYKGAISLTPGLADKLDSDGRVIPPAFKLADLTTFLLDPNYLVHDRYTSKEVLEFLNVVHPEIGHTWN